VNEFLLELYVPRTDRLAVERNAERVRLVAEEHTRQGTHVRYRGSIFLPEEETCFLLFEAVSADAVREAARVAALPFEHVAVAIATEGTP
jgi:hypothetical protein